MIPRIIGAVSWLCAATVSSLAVFAWIRPLPIPTIDHRSRLAVPEHISTQDTTGSKAIIIQHNPFRIARTASAVRYGEEPLPIPDPENSHMLSARPALRLIGVVAGENWVALIDGFPGHDRTMLLREDEPVEGVVIHKVTRDSVVMTAFDTTWVLTTASGSR